jgi:1-acyl-sn-glycerol-3-phosphate acyltransferase
VSEIGDRAQQLGIQALRAYGRALYPAMHLTAAPAVRRMFDIHVDGRRHVPRKGPAIIAPNHLSFLDPLFIVLVLPRRVTFLGKAEYSSSWVTRWWFELAGAIPVDRDDARRASGSLNAGMEVLRNGELLGIFPEGTRSPDGRLYKGKTGVARMALEVGCPVIPTGLTGTAEVLPKDAKVPKRHRVTVRFGEPRTVPEGAKEDAHLLRVFVDEVMQDIATLTGQTYRNRYAYQKRSGSASFDLAGMFA